MFSMGTPNRIGNRDYTEPKDEILPPNDSSDDDEEVLEKDSANANIDHDSQEHRLQSSEATGDLELARTKSIAESMSPLSEFLFVSLLCSVQFVTQAGLMNTLNILHIIGSDLGITDPGVLSWLVAGYSLAIGTFILLSGRAGDLFGYKNMLIIGFLWFAIWNVLAGCSVYAHGKGGQILFIVSRVLEASVPQS